MCMILLLSGFLFVSSPNWDFLWRPMLSHPLHNEARKVSEKNRKSFKKLQDWLMISWSIFNYDMITLNSGCGKFTNFALQLNVFGVTIQQSLMILHFLNLTFASLPMTTIILCIFGSWLSVTISCQSLEPGLSPSDIQIFIPIRDPRANWRGTFCFPRL